MNQKEYELVGGVIYARRENARNLDKLGWGEQKIATAISVIDDLANFMAYELEKNYTNFDRVKFDKICTEGKA